MEVQQSYTATEIHSVFPHKMGIENIESIGKCSFVSCSRDRTISEWRLKNSILKKNHLLQGHGDFIYSVKRLPSSLNILISASADKSLRLWNRHKGKCLKTIPTKENIGGANYSMEVFSMQNTMYIALGRGRDDDYKIRVYQINGGVQQLYCTFPVHQDTVNCLNYLKGTSTLLSGSRDRSLSLWDLQNKRLIYRKENSSKGQINGLIYNEKQDLLIQGGTSRSLTIRKLNNNQNIISDKLFQYVSMKKNIHLYMILGFHNPKNEEFFFSSAADDIIKMWNWQGKLLMKLDSLMISPSALSYKRGYLLAGSKEGQLKIWRLEKNYQEEALIEEVKEKNEENDENDQNNNNLNNINQLQENNLKIDKID